MNRLFLVPAAVLAATPSFAAELHVSVSGSDSNIGSKSKPYKTISAAAKVAQPGDVITVHAGVYRERVNPPRGGVSEAKRIVYQTALGEKVEIKGSEVVKDWVKVQDGVWKAAVPNTIFGDFNPYTDLIHGDWFDSRGRDHHTGAVYLNGEWLTEATKLDEVLAPAGTSPEWVTQSAGYLVNLGWIRPGGQAVKIPATSFSAKNGTQNAWFSEGGECVGFIMDGHWLKYDTVDFKQSTNNIEFRAASAADGGIIEIHLDSPDGELLGACKVTGTSNWQSWLSFEAKIKPISGVKTICLVFRNPKPSAVNRKLWFAQVDDKNTTIWAQFGNIDPNKQLVEINVRRTVFYPEKTGVNYITVRGFKMSQAATPWAPPTAEQIGLIGTHWSKGWIIENNNISYSKCSGIALGKYGDEWDNRAESAEGYVGTIQRALKNGWNKDTVGSHIVRNNTISHCEQAGIVGSLGAAFSKVTGNEIHDIHVQRLFSGAEMAGIKFHGAIDVEISHNHIHHTCLGLWLDWMAQGTRVTGNLFHDNAGQDLFVEVDHGPFLVDNNIFLSPLALLSYSQGGAYVHNLVAGGISQNSYDGRQTPYMKAHSTELAGLHDNPDGDFRFYNNIFVERADLSQYDGAKLPSYMDGNVFLKGAKPARCENDPMVNAGFDPAIKLLEKNGGFYLEMQADKAWSQKNRRLVTTESLGKAAIPDASYENPDGTPLRINTDYFGKKRNPVNPSPGPFEKLGPGNQQLKVW